MIQYEERISMNYKHLRKYKFIKTKNPMGLTIIMGNVRRVMCKVPLTSMKETNKQISLCTSFVIEILGVW